MQTPVTPEQRQAAKREMVKQMEQGVAAREARVSSAVPMHRTTVYRLRRRVQREGEQALTDGRHGHPVKLREEALTFLVEHCQATPSASSPAIQQQIHERFDLCISVSQLNRMRARFGLSRRAVPREKKAQSLPLD